jgi:hypothetical protein
MNRDQNLITVYGCLESNMASEPDCDKGSVLLKHFIRAVPFSKMYVLFHTFFF